MSSVLQRKIRSKTAKVAVIGLGYVGLPLAVSFAKKGFPVIGLDKDEDRLKKIKSGISYILDVSTRDVQRVIRKGTFRAGSDFQELNDADVIIICVPTPLRRKYTPDISYILSAVRTIRRHMKRQTLVVLESTTYPGTTEELIKPELETGGLKAGKDFYLAFSPERIDPGNKAYDVTKIPKIVGGLTPQGGKLTKHLYEKVIREVHLVSTAKAAEMTKLLENTFRIVNIGWANEAAMICRKMGINVWEVIEAAKTKPFGFMPFYPGLGVGGHCIPDDPLYLYWKARHAGINSKFIKLSADINSSMPAYAVDTLHEILKARKKGLGNSKILVVGVTYKKDVKDLRKSPPLSLIELLQAKRAKVDYYDPIIPFLKIGGIDSVSIRLDARKIRQYDCVVIAADHTKTNYALIRKHARLIYDIKNVYAGRRDKHIIAF